MAQHLSDLDVYRSAHLWLELHGENAVTEARSMVRQFRDRGDEAGADTWLRIIIAIEALRQGPERAAS